MTNPFPFLKMTALWSIAPCSLVEVTDVSEVLTASIRAMNDGDSTYILNVGLQIVMILIFIVL
jgi:hypothetical protein